MLKVYEEPCKNCLLSSDAIVSPASRKYIIETCSKEQTYFICHKSKNEDGICCKNFYDKLGYISQMIRIAQRLKMIKFVEQPEGDKLPTYKETKRVD